jgi:hypothetical protein
MDGMCGHRGHRHHHHTSPGRTAAATPADGLRASDVEREEVVGALRGHAAAGRLSIDELDARVEAALAAVGRGELAALLADLPDGRPRRRPSGPGARRRELRAYVAVMVLLVAVWALAGAGAFWPIWPALGWGLALYAKSSSPCGPTTATARRSATSPATSRTSS